MATPKGTSSLEAARRKNLMPVWICLSLAILTVIAFSPIRNSGFVNLDDHFFVYDNAYVQSGLNWNSIGQAFSTELLEKAGWVPLAWLSLMLDTSIFGLNPSGYHLTNLLLHIMNVCLLFLILCRMTKATWPSALVAALFAIHPLHVESVAWIAERRDVLSTFFMMLTLGAYSYYVERRNFKRYALVLLFFILGLMSKSMLVTLPFVLLLLDFWPLGRLSEIKPAPQLQAVAVKPEISDGKKKKSRQKETGKVAAEKAAEVGKPAAPGFKWSLVYPLLLEKIPLFAVAIVSSIATYIAAQSVGFIHSEAIPLDIRIGNAFISYVAYIGQMIWPVNLAVFYPHPENVVLWQVLGAIVMLTAITFFVIWRIKKSPYLATGWLWYVGMLVPVIGIVQLGSQARADRYTYLPLIGLFIILAWGVPELLKTLKHKKEILASSSAIILVVLSVLTYKQVGYWKDSITMFDHALKVTEKNWLAYQGMCAAHNELERYHSAIEYCDRALQIRSHYENAYNSRGNAHSGLGNHAKAIEDYNRAIEIKQDYADAYYNRGIANAALGRYQQAVDDYSSAINITPGHANAYNNRGAAYVGLGDYRKAMEDYGMAIKINPGHADAYNNRGTAHAALNHYREAMEDFGQAIRIDPGFTGAYFNRGVAYARSGNRDLAIRDLAAAAKLGDERAQAFLKLNKINW